MEAYPVITISPSKFTQQQVDKIVQVLFQGATVYNSGISTKSELEERLIQAKADLAKLLSNSSNNDSSKRDLEDVISSLEEAIPNAPETKDTASIQLQANGDGEIRLDLCADLGKKQNATLAIVNKTDGNPLICYARFINTDTNGTYTSFEDYHLPENTSLSLKTTEDNAIGQAKELLDKIGITHCQYSPWYHWWG